MADLKNTACVFSKPTIPSSNEALEQLYGYMTFNNNKYEVLSNWIRTWFLRRVESGTLEYAGPIELDASEFSVYTQDSRMNGTPCRKRLVSRISHPIYLSNPLLWDLKDCSKGIKDGHQGCPKLVLLPKMEYTFA